VTRVLEIHAPLRTGHRRCSSQHDTYVLSDEAVEAKRHRRRLEHRYSRTGLPSDKRAYKAACNAARTRIMTSRADRIRSQQCSKRQATSGPHGALRSHCCTADRRLSTTTRNAQTSSASSVCLSTKVRRIRNNIALRYSSPAAARPHTGPEFSDFQPVTIDEFRKLLASIPRKTSPLDVLPVSLLKDCAEFVAPAITTLANLSMQIGKFPARFKSAQVLLLLKKAGLDRSLPVNYRPISNNLSTVSTVLEKLVLARLRPHLTNSKNFSERQSAYRQGHSTETALFDVRCCSPCTCIAVQSLTSSRPMSSDAINTPMTLSST